MSAGENDMPVTSVPEGRLPNGFVVQVDRRVRVLDSGSALLGGSPTRLLRLAPAAQTMLTSGRLEVRDAVSAQLARTLLDATVAHPRPMGGPGYRDVTIVIPCHNNGFGLRRLLRSLRGLQVIVVDDASDIPVVVEDLQGMHCDVQVVRHDVRRGPAAARNTGLRAATTDFVAFLDSDVVPRRGWLEALLGHFSDPSVALVAPRIVGLVMSDNVIARYEAVRSSLDLGLREAPVVPYSPVSYVPSAAIVARREALVSIGGFDEDLQCGEDVDLCWRLVESGSRLRYEPVSHVAHDHRVTLREWFARKAFYGSSAAPLSRRHPDKTAPMVVSRWTLLVWLLAATGSMWAYLAALGIAMMTVARVTRSLCGVATPPRDIARVAAQGVGGAALQIAAALCRHYWPLALCAALLSQRMRQILFAAAIVDGVVDWAKRNDNSASPEGRIGVVEYLVLKRLDDLAYGIGLWLGIFRERNLGALRPELRP